MNKLGCLTAAFLVVLCCLPMMGASGSDGGEVPGVRAARRTIVVDAGGGGDYTRIQWAIDNASNGDIVFIEKGTYFENIIVDKSIKIVGECNINTIINGESNGNVVEITSNEVIFTGFNITGSMSWGHGGIAVQGAIDCRIENNTCQNNRGFGIYLYEANNITVNNNNCYKNNKDGICLSRTSYCNITNNICLSNFNGGIGISTYSRKNVISNNLCSKNDQGIILGSNNYLSNNLCILNIRNGLLIEDGNNNDVNNNTCKLNGDDGICMIGYSDKGCNSNKLHLNICNSNQDNGIAIYNNSYNNILRNNSLQSNTLYGIKVRYWPSNNLVYHNNFLFNNDNGTQAYDDGTDNEWDDGFKGNYWSDRTTPDINEDGIVDNPYNITGTANAQDHFPLTYPISTQLIFADAGLDVTIDSHQTISFDGSNSWGSPSIANYTWSFEYDSKPIFLYGSNPSFTFDIPGTYVITLNVTNDAGDFDTDWMIVNVKEGQPPLDIDPPTAKAGPDQVIHQNETVTFNASGSLDNVGIVNYTWTFTYNGANVTLYGISPSFTFDIPGTYRITLNVSDARGNRATDSMTLTVRDSTWPKANAGANIVIDQHEVAMFDASDSTDNVGIVNYTWSFYYRAKEIFLFGSTPSFRFDDAGTYTVTLNVTDAEGLWDTDALTVTVRDITPPIANTGNDMTIMQGDRAYFNAGGSSDNVGIANYTWFFLSDSREIVLEGWNTSFVFNIHGEYDVTLTVSDLAGNTASDNLTVTVLERPPSLEIDSDSDGFNDTYENLSGSDPYDPLSTPLDLDGDGWNNSIEVQAGTDPYRKESVPPDRDGDGIPDVLDPDRDGDGVANGDDAYPDDGGKWEEDVETGGRSLWWILGISLALVVAGVVAGAVLVRRRRREREGDEVGGEREDVNGSDEDEVGRVGKGGGDEGNEDEDEGGVGVELEVRGGGGSKLRGGMFGSEE